MKKLKSLFLDVEKGELVINGKDMDNVTAFSLTFKDGEYGLRVTHDDLYTSEIHASKIFLDLLPDKIFDQSITD